jgi:hypothetical protein
LTIKSKLNRDNSEVILFYAAMSGPVFSHGILVEPQTILENRLSIPQTIDMIYVECNRRKRNN